MSIGQRRILRLRTILSAVAIWLVPAFLLAQDGGTVQSILPQLKPQTPLLAWGLAALFLIAALAIAFKGSNRGKVK